MQDTGEVACCQTRQPSNDDADGVAAPTKTFILSGLERSRCAIARKAIAEIPFQR
ncbi:MAG: hypothetical protein ACP5D7_03860 [Limnospira sp.]